MVVPRADKSGDVVALYGCGPGGDAEGYLIAVGGDFVNSRGYILVTLSPYLSLLPNSYLEIWRPRDCK